MTLGEITIKELLFGLTWGGLILDGEKCRRDECMEFIEFGHNGWMVGYGKSHFNRPRKRHMLLEFPAREIVNRIMRLQCPRNLLQFWDKIKNSDTTDLQNCEKLLEI